MVMAAIVMVIMSMGIFDQPMAPKTTMAPNKFGRMPITDKVIDRNNTRNMIAIPSITTPMALICDVNRLRSMLL